MLTQERIATGPDPKLAGALYGNALQLVTVRHELEQLEREVHDLSMVGDTPKAASTTATFEMLLARLVDRIRDLLEAEQLQHTELRSVAVLASGLAALAKNAGLYERERQRSHDLEKLIQAVSGQRDKSESALAIYERLIRTALHGGGVDGITKALANFVENPVAVEDRFFQLISYAPYPTSGRAQKPGGREFAGTPIAALKDPRFRERAHALKKSRPVQMPPFPEHDLHWGRMVAAITVGKKTLGYISAFEKNRGFCEADAAALEHAAAVFALEIQRQKVALEAEQRLKAEFLDDLLAGKHNQGDVALKRAAFVEYGLARPHAILVAELDLGGAHSSDNDPRPRENSSGRKRLLEIVHAIIGGVCAGSTIVSRDDHVIVLLNLVPDLWESKASINPKEIAEVVRQQFSRQSSCITASIAITGTCERPEDYKRSYQIARKSLDILKAFGQCDRVIYVDKKEEQGYELAHTS